MLKFVGLPRWNKNHRKMEFQSMIQSPSVITNCCSGSSWDIFTKTWILIRIFCWCFFLKNLNFQLIWCFAPFFCCQYVLGFYLELLEDIPIKTSILTGFFPGFLVHFSTGTCETWGSDRWIHHHPGRQWHNGSSRRKTKNIPPWN